MTKPSAAQLISASYKTDIPAFYGEWFMHRVREKYVRYKNPYSSQSVGVSLDPSDVIAVVFWTKNCIPFMKHLDEMDRSGLKYYFQYSINGQPRYFEERVSRDTTTVVNFRQLSKRLGAKRTIWRYDPIIFSNETPAEFHRENFARLAKALGGSTERCYISFLDLYAKTQRNMGRLPEGIRVEDPDQQTKQQLAVDLSEEAAQHGITIYTCAENYAVGGNIRKGSCVDADLVAEIFPEKQHIVRASLNRNKCGCSDNRDIGAYDTCPHGCVYCYAVRNRDLAVKNLRAHDPLADALIPMGPNVPLERQIAVVQQTGAHGSTLDMFGE